MAYGTGLAVEVSDQTEKFSLSESGRKKVASLQKGAKVATEFNTQSSCRGDFERVTSVFSVPILLEPRSGLGVAGAAALSCQVEDQSPSWILAFVVGEDEVRLKCTPFEIWLEDPDYPKLF